jgi:hypothetical protein
MKMINDNPYDFFQQGGWSFLAGSGGGADVSNIILGSATVFVKYLPFRATTRTTLTQRQNLNKSRMMNRLKRVTPLKRVTTQMPVTIPVVVLTLTMMKRAVCLSSPCTKKDMLYSLSIYR